MLCTIVPFTKLWPRIQCRAAMFHNSLCCDRLLCVFVRRQLVQKCFLFSLSVAVNKDISATMVKALGYDEELKRWNNIGILVGNGPITLRDFPSESTYFLLARCFCKWQPFFEANFIRTLHIVNSTIKNSSIHCSEKKITRSE